MARATKPKLPPIAVEDRSEKISLSIPVDLRNEIDRFGEFFAEQSGQRPTSFNAVIVGILAGYLENHGRFKKWLKSNHGSPQHTESSAPA